MKQVFLMQSIPTFATLICGLLPAYWPLPATAQDRDHEVQEHHADGEDHEAENRRKPFRDGGKKDAFYEAPDHLHVDLPKTDDRQTRPDTKIVKWNPEDDMPPLQGDLAEMIFQVAEEIEWLQQSDDNLLSPAVRDLLQAAKVNLELGCLMVDDDPELLDGTANSQSTFRDVPGQLKTFHRQIGQILRHPDMRPWQSMLSPIRADGSKGVGLFDSLDEESLVKVYDVLAIETLKVRADELVAYSETVTAGTFRPVANESHRQPFSVGDQALDFRLPTLNGETVTLNHFSGKKLVMVFSSGYFCPTSINQIKQLIEISPNLAQLNAEVFVIFSKTRTGQVEEADVEGLLELKKTLKPPFQFATKFGPRGSAPDSREGSYSTYIIGTDREISAELKGIKYIRPSGKAIVEAVAKAN